MKLTTRFIILVCALLAASSVTAWTGMRGLKALHAEFQAVAQGDMQRLLSITHVRRLFRTMVVSEDESILQPTIEGKRAAVERIQRDSRRLLEEMTRYESLSLPEDRRSLADLHTAFDGWMAVNSQVQQLSLEGKAEEAYAAAERHRQAPVQWEDVIAELIRTNEQRLKARVEEAQHQSEALQAVLMTVVALGTIIALGVGFLVFRGIRRSLSEITAMNDRLEALVAERTSALSKSEAQLRTTIENLDQGLITADTSGRTLHWNSAALEMHGLSGMQEAREACADLDKVFVLLTPAGEPLPLAQWPLVRILRGERLRQEQYRICRRNSDWERVFSYSGALVRDADGSPLMAVLTIVDVTTTKKFEQELIAARLAAESSNRAKSEFLANMSHEVRTPLNGILGTVELLSDMPLSGEQREYVDVVRASGETLLSVINDVLDLSKIQSGKFTLHPTAFSLRRCIERVAAVLMPRVSEKRLGFAIDVSPVISDTITADDLRLGQILSNLLGNAIKFTSEGGSINLQVERDEQHAGGETLHFIIADTGIGIAADKLSDIFKPFSQVDTTTTRRFGGTGLGLSISKDLVELMGGRIWVESTEGRGSCFHFTVPVQYAAAAPKTVESNVLSGDAVSAAAPAEPPLRVLVVEDNLTNQKLVSRMLEKRGHRVTLADNGKEALQLLANGAAASPFDLIFMDCQMPEMDGFQCVTEIRRLESPRGLHTPVIAMTARAMEGDREKCIAAGMDDYISKPFKIAELERIVQRFSAAGR